MNILFVENHGINIFEPQFGAAQRSNLLLNACSRLGHVDVIMFEQMNAVSNIKNCDIIFQETLSEKDTPIKIRLRKVLYLLQDRYEVFTMIDHSKTRVIDSFISKKHYDYIVARYIPDAINCGLMKYADRLVIDMDDNPISVKERMNTSYFESGKRSRWNHFMRSYEIESQKRILNTIERKVKCIFASNIDDVREGIIYLPNIPFWEIESSLCSFEKTPQSILFVGLLNYKPNFFGVKHFLDCILPLIRKTVPKVLITIVGKADKCSLDRWKDDPAIKFKGFVSDLNEEYKNSRVAIVPCYEGSGTNIKVLEAMRQKRPCVTTVTGARGYEHLFKDKIHYLISKTDQEFADNVIQMLNDEEANNNIAENANITVRQNYSKALFYKTVDEVLLRE